MRVPKRQYVFSWFNLSEKNANFLSFSNFQLGRKSEIGEKTTEPQNDRVSQSIDFSGLRKKQSSVLIRVVNEHNKG